MIYINSYNLNVIQDTLNKIHPSQLIKCGVEDIKVSLFNVKYEYVTNRNNKKQGTKYFLINGLSPEQDLKQKLDIWAKDYNENNKHRQISNVKFLDGQCLGFLSI